LAAAPGATYREPMIFPLPTPDNAFRARWRAKVARATAIWDGSVLLDGWRAQRRARLAHRLLDALMRQRDELRAQPPA